MLSWTQKNRNGEDADEAPSVVKNIYRAQAGAEGRRFALRADAQECLFYEYHPPFVTRESILADMKALPPQKQEADRFYVGFFGGEKLAAVLDLIVSYPDDSAAFIGFFMTDVQCQNQGVGTRIVTELCRSLKELGYKKVCLGVDKGNPQSRAFWTKNGFCRIGEKTYVLMERQL